MKHLKTFLLLSFFALNNIHAAERFILVGDKVVPCEDLGSFLINDLDEAAKQHDLSREKFDRTYKGTPKNPRIFRKKLIAAQQAWRAAAACVGGNENIIWGRDKQNTNWQEGVATDVVIKDLDNAIDKDNKKERMESQKPVLQSYLAKFE